MELLIVDDNEDYRKIVASVFADQGWDVLEAADGRQGLSMAIEYHPDLILSDALMPVMDGFQFLREIRRSHVKETLFIFCTATYLKESDRSLAESLGADAFIRKPLNPEELHFQVMESVKTGRRGVVRQEVIENDQVFLRHYTDVVAGKLQEKVKELENRSEEFHRAEDELLRLKLQSRGAIDITPAPKPTAERRSYHVTISPDAYLPVMKIGYLCSMIMDKFSADIDDQGKHYLQQICKIPDRLRNLMDDMLRLPFSRSEVFAPVKRIETMLDVLVAENSEKLGAEGKMFASEVKASLRHIAGILEQLLKLLNLTSMPVKRERVDLSLLANEIIDVLRAKDRNRQVQVEIAEGLVATGDATMLRMLLDYLLEDSWQATAKTAITKICFGIERSSQPPYFFVRDNGTGFKNEDAEKLFIAFQRVPPREAGQIGLAAAKIIVDRHSGRIWASSDTSGVTFSFALHSR